MLKMKGRLKMNQEIITRAGELINLKAGYKDTDGMSGYAALSLIDDNGYPSATTFAITRSDGINWLTFNTAVNREYAKRISKNNKACVCINSSEYTINLVGTAVALTDLETKKENWLPIMNDMPHWSGPEDPQLLIIRFTTERYTIFFADDGSYEKSPE
jgi:general stress protein 26